MIAAHTIPPTFSQFAIRVRPKKSTRSALDSGVGKANLLLSGYTQSVCGQDRQQLMLPWSVGTGAQNRPGMTAFRQPKRSRKTEGEFRTYIHRHQEILILAKMALDTPREEP